MSLSSWPELLEKFPLLAVRLPARLLCGQSFYYFLTDSATLFMSASNTSNFNFRLLRLDVGQLVTKFTNVKTKVRPAKPLRLAHWAYSLRLPRLSQLFRLRRSSGALRCIHRHPFTRPACKVGTVRQLKGRCLRAANTLASLSNNQ